MKNFKSNLKQTVRAFPLLVVMLLCSSAVLAVPGWSNTNMTARQSTADELTDRQVSSAWQPTYQGYRSQIFEVGTTNVPSDYSEVSSGSSNEQGGHKGHLRKLGGGTDPGEQSENSPIGEPWIMFLFALLACGVIAYRKMNIKHHSIMKKIFTSSFHEKLKMLLIAIGLMVTSINTAWANTTFADGDVLFYDFTAVTGGGGVNWQCNGNDMVYDPAGAGTIKCVIFTSSTTWNTSWTVAKTAKGGWAEIKFPSDRPSGKNCLKIDATGKTASWTTISLAEKVAAGDFIMVYGGELSSWGQTKYYFMSSNSTDATKALANANKSITINSQAYKFGPVALPSGTYYQGHWASGLSCAIAAGSAYVVRGSGASTTYFTQKANSGSDYLYQVKKQGSTSPTTSLSPTCPSSIDRGTQLSFSHGSAGVSVLGRTNSVKYYLKNGSTYTEKTLSDGKIDVSDLAEGDYSIITLLYDEYIYVKASTSNFSVVTPASYSLTVEAGTHISTVTGSTDPITLGNSYAISASGFDTGYEFDSWTASPAGNASFASATSASTNVTVSNGSVTVTANAKEKKHNVTVYYKCGSTTIKTETTTSNVGEVTTSSVSAPAISGYTFSSWTAGSGVTTTTSTSSSPVTIKTKSSGTYTITANYTENLTSTYYVEGDNTGPFTYGWNANANTMMMKRTGYSTSSDVYWELEVPASKTSPGDAQWEFKIYNSAGATDNAKWLGWGTGDNHYWLTQENHSITLSTSGSNNIRFKPYVEGTYIFHVNYSTPASPTLDVTWPVVNQLRISAADPSDATNTGNFDLVEGSSNDWSVSRTLNANTTYTFKMVYEAAWYGKNSTNLTRTSNTANSLSTSGADMTIKTDVAGSYTFTFNSSSKNLTVTYPTAYSVTYDGNGKTSGDVPAVSYHIPASDVTLANNSGYLYKEGYAFNGWNTAAEGGGTHYASGGTLAAIGANQTLYAEWVANDYTMYFFNKDDWSPADAYMWSANNDPELAYPGRTMTQYQGQVYQIDYNHNVQAKVVFNNGQTGVDERKTNDLTIAGGQTGNYWFYNDEDWEVKTGGIHDGWSQYIMVGHFPTSTVAAVVGEKVTVVPTVVWADGINFADINITSTRTSGSTNINAVVSGTNIIVSGSEAGTATFNISYTYSTHTEATITKTLTVKVMNGLTIQAKIPSTDDHWVYSNIVKMHYWGGAGTDANPSFEGDVTMDWIKDDTDGKYYQACVPVGTESTPVTNFLFFYDNFSDAWRKTQDITGVTANSCYTIKHDAGQNSQRNAVVEGTGLCTDSWNIQITMGSGDIYTSNIVESSDEIVSFFAPSNASESQSYRRGTVTIEHNGASVATVLASTFSASGVYTAKINTTTPALTNVALYTGDYYIRTDEATGGWDHYDESGKDNKLTKFTRNTKFPNETFSYYWVKNVAKTSEGSGDVNIKAVVANDYNPVLCNYSVNQYISRSTNGTNLRFGYEPTTNDLVRGILKGSTESDFLNIVGEDDNIFKDNTKSICLNEEMYKTDVSKSTFTDVSNWVYLIDVYAYVANTTSEADVVLKSNYDGVHYLLGMVKDATGHDTSTPITYPVIQTGTTEGTYRIRVVYDFKTNRLFGAWNPEDMDVTGTLNVDADVIFIRHEMGDVAQINITNAASKVDKIQQALFALEVENDASKALGNRELHYWITLPFDCKVSNIFGIGGFMNYWGIQRYNGAKRAQIGWFKETDSFWEWLGTEETLQKGEGYLLSIDKYALQQGSQWREYGGKSQLTLYFPSTTNGFSITQATGADLTTTYDPLICTITRDDRDLYDSNWRCIGTPGYKNITVDSWDSIGDKYDPYSLPPRFLYEFHEQTTSAVYAQGTYTVTDGSAFTYHSFNSYLAQYAGTITWNPYSKSGSSSIAPKRSPLEGEKTTKAEIDLLGDDDELLDRAFVWLQEGATIGYDQNYDLNKIVQKKANQIYSLAEAGAPYAANILPFGTDTVQMVVNIVNEGEFIFSLNTDKHVGMAPILYDSFKSEKVNLMTTDYVVELETGKYDDRFFLLFQPEAPIVTSFETTADGGQNVHSSEAIYDVLGRRVNTIYPGHLYIVNGEKRVAK